MQLKDEAAEVYFIFEVQKKKQAPFLLGLCGVEVDSVLGLPSSLSME